MTSGGVIPLPGDPQRSGVSLTDWHVEGEIRCPDCGRYFALDCSLEDVQRFTVTHACIAKASVPP